MLLLSRKVGEKILVRAPGGDIWITVTEIDRGKVRLGISCPREVPIWREELLDRIHMEGKDGQKEGDRRRE